VVYWLLGDKASEVELNGKREAGNHYGALTPVDLAVLHSSASVEQGLALATRTFPQLEPFVSRCAPTRPAVIPSGLLAAAQVELPRNNCNAPPWKGV
jgi:hypothetical protein